MTGPRVVVQGTLGFGGPVFGERPRVKVVRLAVCAMFVMADTGDGWFPVCAASDGLALARDLMVAQYPDILLTIVNPTEVGK